MLSIPDEIDASLLRGALTIAGSELLDWDEILGGNLLVVGKKTPVVYVTVGGRSADARVVLEPVLEPPPIRPPVRPRGDRDGNE